MKRYISSILLAVGLCASAYEPVTLPVIPPDPALEQKVAERLASMSLDEKIGQMIQLQIDKIGDKDAEGNFVFSQAKADSVIGTYKVGSFLNTPGGSKCLTAAEWCDVISRIQATSLRVMGIPTIYGLDQNHGTTYTADGTIFPQNINIAATFNTELPRRAGAITAYETRASDCPWTFSPTLDLARDPRWPRFWENYGEDPLVNALMGAAAVRGFQGDDPNHVGPKHIAVSLKHYMGYGVPFSGKDRTPAYISPSDLREKHFAPYLEAIKNGALTIMVNSASVNGTPVHANPLLLTRWLKEDLQWDGMIVTDWADINNLYTREKVARDKKDAIRIAINAGIDMAMEPYKCDFCTLLKELVQEGKVPVSRIDDAAARVLRLKYRLGLFDRPDTWRKDYPDFACKAYADAALEAAEESMVLLKNDNSLLPLAPGTKLFVTGPTADSMRSLNGGWSYSWQGHLADKYAAGHNTIVEALQQRFGRDNVSYAPTLTFAAKGNWDVETDCTPAVYAEAYARALKADVIVMCLGENSYCESKGNLSDLHLSPLQRDMVRRFARAGKPMIFLLNEGRPRLIADIEPLASAVICAMLPGNYGGDALARLMAGDVNFSGKLPFTYPREINSLVTYDYKVAEEVGRMEGTYDYDAKINIQWPFGYGRSYTTYQYSDLKVDKTDFTAADRLTVSLLVTNTGRMHGKEAVLLYSSDHVASVTPDNKRLRAFDKIALMPGETRAVSFTIPATDLAIVGADGRWVLEEGDFTLTVGNLSLPVRCTATTTFDRPNI